MEKRRSRSPPFRSPSIQPFSKNHCPDRRAFPVSASSDYCSAGSPGVVPPPVTANPQSIAFTSAVPSTISLKGYGTSINPETSIVSFTVKGTDGNPLAGADGGFLPQHNRRWDNPYPHFRGKRYQWTGPDHHQLRNHGHYSAGYGESAWHRHYGQLHPTGCSRRASRPRQPLHRCQHLQFGVMEHRRNNRHRYRAPCRPFQ